MRPDYLNSGVYKADRNLKDRKNEAYWKKNVNSLVTYISQADLVILQAFISQGFYTVCQFITKKMIQPGFSISSGFAFPSNMKYKVLLISFPDEALGSKFSIIQSTIRAL